uniref:Putative secreted protein n=1 Tax=Anopheles darlingi TaxID=43151 RepID=A0A2M4D2I8_ANODA
MVALLQLMMMMMMRVLMVRRMPRWSHARMAMVVCVCEMRRMATTTTTTTMMATHGRMVRSGRWWWCCCCNRMMPGHMRMAGRSVQGCRQSGQAGRMRLLVDVARMRMILDVLVAVHVPDRFLGALVLVLQVDGLRLVERDHGR